MRNELLVAGIAGTLVSLLGCTMCDSLGNSGGELPEHGLRVSNGVGSEPDQVLRWIGADEVRGYLYIEVHETSTDLRWHVGRSHELRARANAGTGAAFENFVARVRRVDPMIDGVVIVVDDDVSLRRLVEVLDHTVELGLRARVLVDEATGQRVADAGG